LRRRGGRSGGDGIGDPGADKITELLLSPPSPAQITAGAEQLVFSD
jgi:hypothetical protein